MRALTQLAVIARSVTPETSLPVYNANAKRSDPSENSKSEISQSEIQLTGGLRRFVLPRGILGI